MEDKPTRVAGVYIIKGVKNSSTVTVTQVDTVNITSNSEVRDTSLTTYTIDEQKGLFGEVFASNLVDAKLMSSKKQPLIYISTFLSKPLKTAMLYDIILYFTIDDEVSSESEFLSRPLKGKFSLELCREGQSVSLDMDIDKFPGEERMLTKLMDFTKTADIVDILYDQALEEEEKIASKYKTNFKYDEIPKPTVNLSDYDIEDYY